MSRLREQRDGICKVAAHRFDEREAPQDQQRKDQAPLAGIVTVVMMTMAVLVVVTGSGGLIALIMAGVLMLVRSAVIMISIVMVIVVVVVPCPRLILGSHDVESNPQSL
jgi:hypothetical protein